MVKGPKKMWLKSQSKQRRLSEPDNQFDKIFGKIEWKNQNYWPQG